MTTEVSACEGRFNTTIAFEYSKWSAAAHSQWSLVVTSKKNFLIGSIVLPMLQLVYTLNFFTLALYTVKIHCCKQRAFLYGHPVHTYVTLTIRTQQSVTISG